MTTNASLHSIECSYQPLDLSFHPKKKSLVAAALVDGTLEIHDFSSFISNSEERDDRSDASENDTIVSSTPLHTQMMPCRNTSIKNSGKKDSKESIQKMTRKPNTRAVHFSVASQGDYLYTGGSAGDLCCINAEVVSTFSPKQSSESLFYRIPVASHNYEPIQVIHELPADCFKGPLLVSGDEGGGVRCWDDRLCRKVSSTDSSSWSNSKSGVPQGCVFSFKENSDYISGFDHSLDGNTLLATSADATLSVFDLRMVCDPKQAQHRQIQPIRRSDDQEDELLSVKTMKHGKKVVCGTHEGVLSVFSWGRWGDVSDRFPGHPSSIDALLKIDEDTLLTGSSDGLLRVVSIQPDKFLGVLGYHNGFPIEKLEFNSDHNFVGSVSHDNYIRLWDAKILKEDYDSDDCYSSNFANNDEKNHCNNCKDEITSSVDISHTGSIPKPFVAKDGSDDDWEDVGVDCNNDGNSYDLHTDDDSVEEEDEKPATKNDRRRKRLKTENEKFFADL